MAYKGIKAVELSQYTVTPQNIQYFECLKSWQVAWPSDQVSPMSCSPECLPSSCRTNVAGILTSDKKKKLKKWQTTVTALFPFFKAGGKKGEAIVLEHLSGKPGYLNNIKKRLAGQVAISTLLALTRASGLRRGVNGGSAVALGTDKWIIAGHCREIPRKSERGGRSVEKCTAL